MLLRTVLSPVLGPHLTRMWTTHVTSQQGRKGKERVACANCHVEKTKKMFPKVGHWKHEGGLCRVCLQVKDSDTHLAVAAVCDTCEMRFTRTVTKEEGGAEKKSDGDKDSVDAVVIECEGCARRTRKRKETNGVKDDEKEPRANLPKRARKDPPLAETDANEG